MSKGGLENAKSKDDLLPSRTSGSFSGCDTTKKVQQIRFAKRSAYHFIFRILYHGAFNQLISSLVIGSQI